MNQPKQFTARAAELSGLESLPELNFLATGFRKAAKHMASRNAG